MKERIFNVIAKTNDKSLVSRDDGMIFYINNNEYCAEEMQKEEYDKVSCMKNISEFICDQYSIKNTNYGDSFSKLYDKFGKTTLLIRLNDKLSRLESLVTMGSDGTEDERISDTLLDLATYAIMGVIEMAKENKNND